MHAIARHIQAHPSLELKTRSRFQPVSLSLSIFRVSFVLSMKIKSIMLSAIMQNVVKLSVTAPESKLICLFVQGSDTKMQA
jgi:hypothetical protein